MNKTQIEEMLRYSSLVREHLEFERGVIDSCIHRLKQHDDLIQLGNTDAAYSKLVETIREYLLLHTAKIDADGMRKKIEGEMERIEKVRGNA